MYIIVCLTNIYWLSFTNQSWNICRESYSIGPKTSIFIIFYYIYILHFRVILTFPKSYSFIYCVSTMALVSQLVCTADVDKT